MSELTHHIVRKFRKGAITLTRDEMETILRVPLQKGQGSTKDAAIILIGVNSRDRIVTIPIEQGKPIIKMIAKMVPDYADTILELNSIITTEELKHFYTTGVCVKNTHCVHESYLIPETARPITKDEVRTINEQLSAIKGMIHASLELVWDGD